MTALAALPREALAVPGPARAALIGRAAASGDAAAQMVYGQMLLDGVEVARDPIAALGWFTRAAQGRDMAALNMVGRCHDLGWGCAIDKARAAACYRLAAEAGEVPAMYNYATLLALGHGVAIDRAAALAWLEKASARGFAKATNFVGSFAEDGWAGPRDMDKATARYRRAALGGDFRGCFNLARMLIDAGRIDAAIHWIGRAAVLGHDRFRGQMRDWLTQAGEPIAARGLAAIDTAC